jgi:hypothetical protein
VLKHGDRFAVEIRTGVLQRGDPSTPPVRDSARVPGSEWEWVKRPEVAQHRHVVLVLDAHCDLMDLGDDRSLLSA